MHKLMEGDMDVHGNAYLESHGGSGSHVVWPPKDKDTSSYCMSNKISSTPHQNLSWIRIPHFKKGRGTGWVGRFMPKLMEVHGSP